MSDYLGHHYWYLENPTDAKAYQDEFGFTLPDEWELSEFRIHSSPRGLQLFIDITGEMDSFEDICANFHFSLNKMETSLEYDMYENLDDHLGMLYVVREDEHWRISISKYGLKNKSLRKGLTQGI